MSNDDKNPKKRGRKPKNKVLDIIPQKNNVKSEEEPLIAHLNINLQDILNGEANIISSPLFEDDSITHVSDSDSIFIKPDEDNSNNEIGKIENDIIKLKNKLYKLTKNNKIEVTKSTFTKDTKCWWCKNSFDSPAIQLPELNFQNKFYCIGHFCSFNCALSYNIDSNDNVWKRTSLLNLLYYKTYNDNQKIVAAPNWKQLIEFGGNLTIEKFRKDSIINNSDYTLLHPPLETRINTFEKIYNTQPSVNSSSMYQKLLEDSDELVLKRSNPLKSSQYSLDKTLLIKKKEKRRKVNKTTNALLCSA